MIVSANPTPELLEFDSLLKSTVAELNSQSGSSKQKINDLSGIKLEQYTADIMKSHAIGTPFENSILCTLKQDFPDIVAKKLYGVEVKTTIKNHWKTTGNSVLESSRLPGVERIFILFGKLADPVEFRYRPYEDCLAEVVVTHSPRYLIDMNLKPQHTIFDRINIPYDDLRKLKNPIKEITNYYKKGLKKGDELWWLDQTEPPSSNIIIKIWSNLTLKGKKEIIAKAFTYFPELLSNSNDKFSRLAVWLITTQGIVCPNLRDVFTSGGTIDVITANRIYYKTPRILYNLFKQIDNIKNILIDTPSEELSEYWNIKTTENKKLNDWQKLIFKELTNLKGISQNDKLDFVKELW